MGAYFIKRGHESIEPEEILLEPKIDAESEYERLEFAISPFLLRGMLVVSIAALLVLIAYTFYLQVIRGGFYSELAEFNRRRLLFDSAPRGTIYDRTGVVLAENIEVFDVIALALNLPDDETEIRREGALLAEILGVDAVDITSKLIKVKNDALAEPRVIFANIPASKAVELKRMEVNLDGIRVIGRFQRSYPQGPAFSHLIGYVGQITREEIDRLGDVSSQELMGRSGIELAYDAALRGESGKQAMEVNAALKVLGVERIKLPKPGKNVHLTIDADLQKFIYQVLLTNLPMYGYERAAAVAIHPKTGEVLAMVSVPSFDANLLVKGISQKDFAVLVSKESKPMFNRALAGIYSPGSTIKPFIAAAALEEGIVTPDTLIDGTRGFIEVPNPYEPEKPSIYRDWRAHGFVDIRNAIAWSSNVYFYTIGGGYGDIKGLGISRIKKYLELFGFGNTTGIELGGEAEGLVPDPERKRIIRPQDPFWRIGDTYITSIGQGDLLVTPLQLAMAYSAIANGGTLLKPQIVSKVVEAEENGAGTDSIAPIAIRSNFISPENIKVVQQGMRLTIAAGSARQLADLPFGAAGKTGTVQVSGATQPNAVFAVYAPYQDPEIVLVVIVEKGGEGSYSAVPIAHQILWWYWQNRMNPS